MPTMIGSRDFGGGYVRLAFTAGDERMLAGRHLSAARIKSFENHRRLIATGHIAVYPPAPEAAGDPSAEIEAKAASAPPQAFLIHRGGGSYDVIVGARLNAEPLSKEQAEALARGH